MLIIFGTQTKQREVNEVGFLPDPCPHCGKTLKVMELTRWMTLFFIPVIKTDTLGFFYWCPSCNIEFSANDLKLPKYN
jgi:hypothetical protein